MRAETAPADPYEPFAGLYDTFTAGSDYEAWTGHVLGVARGLGLAGRRMLDVACGTGKSFLPFVARGFEVTGCDVSPAMLAHARLRAPEVPLVEADVRELPVLGGFDLITCFDDSLNHLLCEEDLLAALRALAANLRGGGLLLFDLNTLLTFRTTFARDSVFERGEALFACRGDSSEDAPPGSRASVRIDAFTGHGDVRSHLTTTLHERHFPPHRVVSLLAAAELRCASVHGVLADGAPASALDETRELKALYAARPEGRAC